MGILTSSIMHPWMWGFAGTLLGALIGLCAVVRPVLVAFLSAAGLMGITSYFLLRRPEWTVVAFWLCYTLQTTVFAGSALPEGVFYPIYLAMLVNTVRSALTRNRELRIDARTMMPYALFYASVVLGLIWQPSAVSVSVGQRLFIYSLGVLVAGQLASERARTVVLNTMILTGCLVSVWTIAKAHASGFAYRAGVGVNPNYVATVIDLGLIPLFGMLTDRNSGVSSVLKAGLWTFFGLGLYANLLLASRGMTIALGTTLVIILLIDVGRRHNAFWPVVGLSIVLLVVTQLPGSASLLGRALEGGDALNGRFPIWQAGLDYLRTASLRTLLLGYGMGETARIVSWVNPWLTSIHNVYLQFAIEYGLVGLTLFLVLLVLVMNHELRASGLRTGRLGILLFLAIGSLTATIADNHLFWVALGLSLPVVSARGTTAGKLAR